MAVAFDALGPSSAGSGTTNTTSISWNHTCSGSNRLLIVGVGMGGATASVTTSVTYNSVGMTSMGQVLSDNQTDGWVEMFYLIAPSTGTNQVVYTCSHSRDLTGGSLSYTGVDQTTPVVNTATAFGASTTPSVNVTNPSGNIVVDAVVCGSAITSSNQTLQWKDNLAGTSGAGNAAQSTSTSTGTVTMSYVTPSDWWGIIATSVAAASGGGGPTATIAWLSA